MAEWIRIRHQTSDLGIAGSSPVTVEIFFLFFNSIYFLFDVHNLSLAIQDLDEDSDNEERETKEKDVIFRNPDSYFTHFTFNFYLIYR